MNIPNSEKVGLPVDEEIEVLINNEREWRRYLIKKIDALEELHTACSRTTFAELSELKVKASIWGALSGGGVVLIGMAIYAIQHWPR